MPEKTIQKVQLMKRLQVSELVRWLNKANRKPLIVWGARQIGKSYLVKDLFAEEYFPNSHIYIDFRLEAKIRDFCMETVNPAEIMEFISIEKNKKITEDTLLIFDEIQECPSIITSLKYFCQDFRKQPVIATGSMVRIKIKRITHKRGSESKEEFLFPVGKIDQLNMHPMTFDEFLINYNEPLYNKIVEAYRNRRPIDGEGRGNTYHLLAMEALHKYLMIGSLPEAIQTYIDTESFFESREVLKNLYDNYLSDMELYQASPESIVRTKKIFSNIYSELNKENKNFKSSLIEEKSKTRDMKTPIDWLTMAGIVYQSFELKEKVTAPLICPNESNFRLYLCDTGMFIYQSGINASTFLSKEGRNTLSGIFFENYIANEMTARGLKLFYWKGKNSAELEFFIEYNGNAIAVDVKKGRKGLKSLEKYRNLNKKHLAVKISENNYDYDSEQKLLTLPLYEAFLFFDDAANETLGDFE